MSWKAWLVDLKSKYGYFGASDWMLRNFFVLCKEKTLDKR